jgi:hypothetical protein
MISKVALAALLGLAAVASATSDKQSHMHMYGKTLKANKEVKKGHFGQTEIAEYHEEGEYVMTKTVYPPAKTYVRDYERQTRALNQAIV